MKLMYQGNELSGGGSQNLLTDTSDDWQEVTTTEGSWAAYHVKDIYLPLGTYTLSGILNTTDFPTNVTLRIEQDNGSRATSIDGSSQPTWGVMSNNWIRSGTTGFNSISFKVTKAGYFHVGYSGSPFKAGKFKVKDLMLNLGPTTKTWCDATVEMYMIQHHN